MSMLGVHESLWVRDCLVEISVLQWGAESSFAGQWLPAAGWDGAWAIRTGSGPMLMYSDIFAATRLWRCSLLTTRHLSSSHPVVVGAGDVAMMLFIGT